MRCGQHNVVLMRDMTDTMYNPAKPPFVSHFEGNRLFRDYVEEFVRSQRDPRFSFGTVPKMHEMNVSGVPNGDERFCAGGGV